MAINFQAGITVAAIVGDAQARLVNMRRAMQDVQNYYAWLQAYQPSDLVALGMDSSSAQAVFSAFADANAVCQINFTGLPPGSYPQPPSAYNYAASQRIITGPAQL